MLLQDADSEDGAEPLPDYGDDSDDESDDRADFYWTPELMILLTLLGDHCTGFLHLRLFQSA